jgi:GGDEF domain-containing protein
MSPRPEAAPLPRDRRVDRYPAPSAGRWCPDARDDPITGLIAWPGFYQRFPALLVDALRAGARVGFAIGDVDGLKEHVETIRSTDPESFGHLAGNALMRRLGNVARDWWLRTGIKQGCLATFGGDEIVLVAEIPHAPQFTRVVCDLRDRLRDTLPRPVSFAATTITPDLLPTTVVGEEWTAEFCTHLIGEVDRALLTHKQARRLGEHLPLGFVADVRLPVPTE